MLKNKKKVTNLLSDIYKPVFVPHYKGLCEELHKQFQMDLKNKRKNVKDEGKKK